MAPSPGHPPCPSRLATLAATSLLPSAEDATEDQELLGAFAIAQLAPELVEVQIEPPTGVQPSSTFQYLPISDTATNLFPSAEAATPAQ